MSVPTPANVHMLMEYMKKIGEAAEDVGKTFGRLSRDGKKRPYREDPTARMTHKPFAENEALKQLQKELAE